MSEDREATRRNASWYGKVWTRGAKVWVPWPTPRGDGLFACPGNFDMALPDGTALLISENGDSLLAMGISLPRKLSVGTQCDLADLCRTREECEALIAHRASVESVAKARDAAIEAAKAWRREHIATCGDESYAWREALDVATRMLLEAERDESEARARLEALR